MIKVDFYDDKIHGPEDDCDYVITIDGDFLIYHYLAEQVADKIAICDWRYREPNQIFCYHS